MTGAASSQAPRHSGQATEAAVDAPATASASTPVTGLETDKRPATGAHGVVRPEGAPPVRRSLADLPVIEQKETRRVPWLPLLALVAMTVLIVSKLWPGRSEVPRNVMGEWSSTDPLSAGRRLRIDSVELVLDNGSGGETHGRITEVESSSDAEGLEVRIDYRDGERTASIALRYRGGREEYLLVGEQRGARWVRSGSLINDGTPESLRPRMPDSWSAPSDPEAPVPPEGRPGTPTGASGPPR